ncbi:MAG: ribose-5-phosphate isomerase RpiA [Rubrivivax sp.]|jgi:ribose 5-phosphate isomerase A|nr:ribose-5-phosphate isomerase RpiA [Rubrivivax sp.]
MAHDTDALKAQVGEAAARMVAELPSGSLIGVGTGSTANHFIAALGRLPRGHVGGAVSSSEASTARLHAAGIRVLEAAQVERLPLYVDGADEIDPRGHMIKGAGAALTREKIVADLAERFVCIADASKQVAVLGRFPLPVEVIAMGSAQIARRFAALGGRAVVRAGVLTDNVHPLLDVHDLRIDDPLALESEINQWPGVVTVGIFARHRAHSALIAAPDGVRRIDF